MTVSIDYLASVFNSTLRYMTPILLVALCAGVCSKVKVFNIALEGTLLTSAFFAFLTQYFVRNIWLSVLVAVLIGMLMTFIMAFFIVKLKGQSMIVGMALNTFALGFTTFLLSMIFHTKGTVSDPTLKGLPKVTLPLIKDSFFSGLVTTFVRSITAISAIILLVTPRYLLITCRINEFAEKGAYGVACAYATILILIVYAAILIMNLGIKYFGTSKQVRLSQKGE